MNDMSSVIVPKSDQINADDLIAGPMTIRVASVAITPGTEQPVSIFFEGDDGKPFRPCKSMSRVLVAAWGADAKAYIGRSMTLYRDPKVKWGGMEVGGIRISHLSDIEREMVMALTATKGKRAPYSVKPLAAPPPPASNGRAKAEAWVAEYLKAPTEGATTAKILAKLAKEYPDLYAQVTAAREPDDDDPFGLPPIQPAKASSLPEDAGPSNEPAIEAAPVQPDDESIIPALSLDAVKAEIDRKELVTDIRGYLSTLAGQLSEDDLEAAREYGFARVGEMEGR